MDYQRFGTELPGLYEDWGQPTVRPRSGRWDQVLHRVRGMTTPCVLQLLNAAVGCLEGDEVYAEVGCFQGASLIGALLDHHGRVAYAVDNFALFDPDGSNRARLRANLAAFDLEGRVRFHDQDFGEFLWRQRGRGPRIGVYYYDGAHDYRSQLLGLLLAVPLLAERALVVVDDANWACVKQATWDFLALRPECRPLWELATPGNCHPTFWNGVYVLAWDADNPADTDWVAVQAEAQPALLGSLDALQWVNVRIRQGLVEVTRAV
jgi:hypothetical protein